MHEQWALIGTTHLLGSRRDKAKSLDDPLDRPEWDGLRWALAILSFLSSGLPPGGSRAKSRPTRAVPTQEARRGAVVGHRASPTECRAEGAVSR